MKISPALCEAVKIADAGKYNVLPVSCEILSALLLQFHPESIMPRNGKQMPKNFIKEI